MYDKKQREEDMKRVYEDKRWKALEINLKIVVTIVITFIWVWIFCDRFELIPPGLLRFLALTSVFPAILIGRIAVVVFCDFMRHPKGKIIYENNEYRINHMRYPEEDYFKEDNRTEEEKNNDYEKTLTAVYYIRRNAEDHLPQEWETIDQNTRIMILREACKTNIDVTQTETYKQLIRSGSTENVTMIN